MMSKQAPTQDDQQARGIACRRCGCRHWYTIRTVKRDGYILRERECRHCGARKKTREE